MLIRSVLLRASLQSIEEASEYILVFEIFDKNGERLVCLCGGFFFVFVKISKTKWIEKCHHSLYLSYQQYASIEHAFIYQLF